MMMGSLGTCLVTRKINFVRLKSTPPPFDKSRRKAREEMRYSSRVNSLRYQEETRAGDESGRTEQREAKET